MPERVVVAPMDEHNQKLVSNVHPDDWTNPEPDGIYHLVAIGAGAAGLVSSAIGAAVGAKVALIERHLLGGDCLNVGCVPSKGVISAARAWHTARTASDRFAGPEATGSGDFSRAMERMRRLRATISPVDSTARYRDLGVDVYLGSARFTGPDSIEVDGKTLRFKRAVIATGARAAAPPIPGLEEAGYLTNETVFTLTQLPRRFLVVGAGPIGCELAQSFARFGSEVTLLDRAEHVLPREDADAARIVERALEGDGVRYLSGCTIRSVERRGDERVIRYEREGASHEAVGDAILIAIGRAPNVEGLGLDAAGVAFDARAGVTVDDRLRTSNPRIYAAGDICSRFKFTHAADFLAQIAVQNSLFHKRLKASDLIMPWTTYTSPEIAHVGLYEKDAIEAGHEVETITVPLEENDRALLDGETEGFFRVHVARGKDRILGATLVSSHAGDMIGEIALAMRHRIGLKGIQATIHPYPTQGEIFRKAALELAKKRFAPWQKKLLGLILKTVR